MKKSSFYSINGSATRPARILNGQTICKMPRYAISSFAERAAKVLKTKTENKKD